MSNKPQYIQLHLPFPDWIPWIQLVEKRMREDWHRDIDLYLRPRIEHIIYKTPTYPLSIQISIPFKEEIIEFTDGTYMYKNQILNYDRE